MKTTTLLIIIIFSLGITLSFTGCGNNPSKDYSELAQCLTEKGVELYGAIWCSHCQKQKKAFGAGEKYLNYFECDPRTDLEGAKKCLEEKIEAYPTWILPDGTHLVGEQDVESLGARVGCEVPEEDVEN